MTTAPKGGNAATAKACVHVLSNDCARDIGPESLIVMSRDPGQRRAGVAHPAFAVYPAGHFTPEQMRLMRADTNLCLIAVD
ncbi:hypothetical protein [Komagataeibacter xylinus]|uniref:hypothetical protein n=1 Tax=Komagataeibacter xylinus TaxID=28448 RepID=UPI00280A554E|nr:hypothetical protein [Komagataeibacter xylinus]